MNKWYLFGGIGVVAVVGIVLYTTSDQGSESTTNVTLKEQAVEQKEKALSKSTSVVKNTIPSTDSKGNKLSDQQRIIASNNPNSRTTRYDKTLDQEEIIDNPAIHSQKVYKEMNKYPLTNTKFTKKEADPVISQYTQDVRVMHNPDNPGYSIEVFAQKNYFVKGENIDIRARLKKDGALLKGKKLQAMVSYNNGISEENLTTNPVTLKDSNSDGEYELIFSTENAFGKKLKPGSYEAIIAWEDKAVGKKGTMGETISFVYSDPGARLTGNYKDEIIEGSLVISAQVLVTTKSIVNLEATIYSTSDQPILAVQNGIELDKGKHWIPLKVYGLILHEKKLNGPYVLKHITLTKTSNPPMRGRLITPSYKTSNYEWGQFTDKSYNSLQKRNQSLSKM